MRLSLLLFLIVVNGVAGFENLVSTADPDIFNINDEVCMISSDGTFFAGKISKLRFNAISVSSTTEVQARAVIPGPICKLVFKKNPDELLISEIRIVDTSNGDKPLSPPILKNGSGKTLNLVALYDDYVLLIRQFNPIRIDIESIDEPANKIKLLFKITLPIFTESDKFELLNHFRLPRIKLSLFQLNFDRKTDYISLADATKLGYIAYKSQSCKYEKKKQDDSCFSDSDKDFLNSLSKNFEAKIKSKKSDVSTVEIHQILCTIYYIQFQYRKALELSHVASKKFPKEDSFVENIIVYHAEKKENNSLALFLEKQNKRIPTSRNFNFLASLAIQKADYDTAGKHYEAAMKLNPKDETSQIGILMLKLRTGRPISALERKALIASETDDARLALLLVDMLSGNFRGAYLSYYAYSWKDKDIIAQLKKAEAFFR